jgi:hypothetical protein
VTCGESGTVAKIVAANTKATIDQAFMSLALSCPMARAEITHLPCETRETKRAAEPMLFNIAHWRYRRHSVHALMGSRTRLTSGLSLSCRTDLAQDEFNLQGEHRWCASDCHSSGPIQSSLCPNALITTPHL